MANEKKDQNQTRRPQHQQDASQQQNPRQQQQTGERDRKDQGGQADKPGMDEGRQDRDRERDR